MRNLAYFLVGILIALSLGVLSGCQAPRLKTSEDYIGSSYVTVKALANTVKTYRDVGIITDQEAQKYKVQLGDALTAIDIARGKIEIGDKTGLEILQEVNRLLLRLQVELEAKQ